MYTPSPLNDTTGAGVESVVMEDDLVSKLSDDFSSTDNRDVTEIDEDINLGEYSLTVFLLCNSKSFWFGFPLGNPNPSPRF